MMQKLTVRTPQGLSGALSNEDGQYLFTYADSVRSEASISLSMPVRSKQYAQKDIHPIFQMNMPEGFMLEELRNRLAKTVKIDSMLLLSIASSHDPIGRVQVDPLAIGASNAYLEKKESLSEILEWDGKENLFDELVNKYILRAGISGVQPKVLVPCDMQSTEPRATARTEDLIVKSGRQEYPGLAANEFLCMTIAKEAGMPVPEFYLSENKELFVMKRFDRGPDAEAIGFEDFAAIAGLASSKKYERSYGFIAKNIELFVSPQNIRSSLSQLFDIVALSCLLGNGDAHLKNFGVLYTDPSKEDCRLAPAYDIVNTTSYIPEDVLALDLKGHKTFFSACEGLRQFGMELRIDDPADRVRQLILIADFVLRREGELCESIPHVVSSIRTSLEMFERVYFDRNTHIQRPKNN